MKYEVSDNDLHERGKCYQKPLEAEEKAKRLAEGRTQGRAGCKAKRIMMAFTTPNHEFIEVCSQATGVTMTKFVNSIIDAYRAKNPELMKMAQKTNKAVQKAFKEDVTAEFESLSKDEKMDVLYRLR